MQYATFTSVSVNWQHSELVGIWPCQQHRYAEISERSGGSIKNLMIGNRVLSWTVIRTHPQTQPWSVSDTCCMFCLPLSTETRPVELAAYEINLLDHQ